MTTLRRTGLWLDAAVGDETLMRHVETGRFMSLNETASVLWKRLETPASEGDLARALVASFEVSPEIARCDVAAFVEVVAKEGAVEQS